MKKNNILFYLLAGIIFFGSCYDDKGNYDYNEPLTVSISGFESSYELNALMESITVSPTIEPAGREYECFWGVYQTNVQGAVPKLDTIGFTRDVDYLIDRDPGGYMFVYAAKDKKTGISSIIRSTLTVKTALTTGWYLLKEQNGMTDYDLHNNEGIISDVILKNNGRQLVGSPVGVRFLTDYKGTLSGSNWLNTTVLVTLSNNEIAVVKVNNGEIIRDSDGVFYESPAVIRPQAIFKGSAALLCVNNGLAYGIYTMSSNQGRFGEPIGNFSYDLANQRLASGVYPPVLYDKLSSSFVTLLYNSINKMNEPTNDNAPVQNLNSDIIFATQRGTWDGFVMLKNKSTGEYDLRKIYLLANPPNGNGFTTQQYSVDASHRITKGKFWSALANNDVIFYDYEGAIYSCNLAGGLLETKLETIHNADEEITYIQYLSSSQVAKLVIATYKAGKYKVYLYDILAGIIDSTKEVTIFEGDGKVSAAIHINNTVATETY